MGGNAAERSERSLPIVGGNTAAELVRQATALGVRLEARPGGLWADKVNRLPPELRDGLAAHRAAVIASLTRQPAADSAPPLQAQPHSDWRMLPYGRERGRAFAEAQVQPGACRCCAGRRWWTE